MAVGESDLTIEKDKRCGGVAVGNLKKDPLALFRAKKDPEQAPEVHVEPVRYMHANGELREVGDDSRGFGGRSRRSARRVGQGGLGESDAAGRRYSLPNASAPGRAA